MPSAPASTWASLTPATGGYEEIEPELRERVEDRALKSTGRRDRTAGRFRRTRQTKGKVGGLKDETWAGRAGEDASNMRCQRYCRFIDVDTEEARQKAEPPPARDRRAAHGRMRRRRRFIRRGKDVFATGRKERPPS